MAFSEQGRSILRTALLLSLLLIAGLLPAPAAQAKEQFVAVVVTGDLPRYKAAHEAFVGILRSAGMSEEKLKIYVQTPNPDKMSWANSLRKATGVGADLIVTYGAPVSLFAKTEVQGTPLLFADVYDPVALGLVKDLNVTGGEISGVSSATPIEALVVHFTQVFPAKNVGVLYSSQEQGSNLQAKKIEEQGHKAGFSVVPGEVKSSADLNKVLESLVGKIDSLFVTEGVAINMNLPTVMEFAAAKGWPVFSQIPGLGEQGALINLEADPVEQGQLLGVHAIQVLNGQKVFSLPVRVPKKVALVINLKTAAALQIKVPPAVLASAGRVIK